MLATHPTARLEQIIRHRCGVIIDAGDTMFLQTRLHSLMELHRIPDLATLTDRLAHNEPLLDEVIDLITTHESLFFRDDVFFQALREEVFPYFHTTRKEHRRLRIWSAACAFGQEPYSLAMLCLTHPLNFSHWDIRITATDISKSSLARAKKGTFSHFEVQRGLSALQLAEHFDKTPDGWTIQQRVAKMVQFEHVNLIEPFPNLGQFDLILIRNVLIYFDPETKRSILHRAKAIMPPDGILGLGGPETMWGITNEFKPWGAIASSLYCGAAR